MRPVCVRQEDGSDCGAAALATVARYYRRPIPLQQMRDLTGTDRVGTTLAGLVTAAKRLGFHARAVEGSFGALRGIPLPAIAHVTSELGNGHFVVVYSIGKKKLRIADPGQGLLDWSVEEFLTRWTRHLILLLPMGDAPSTGAPKRPFARLLALLSGQVGPLSEAAACALITTLLGLASSFYIQQLLDSILVHQRTQLLNLVGIGMVLILAFRMVFGLIEQYILAVMSRKIDLRLMRQYFGHLLRLPIQFFESRKVGEILSRLSDASRIRSVISGTTISIVLDGICVVGASIAMFCYSTKLALVALIFAPALGAYGFLFLPAIKRNLQKTLEGGAVLQGRMVEDVTGIEAVKALALESDREDGTEGAMVLYLQELFNGQVLTTAMNSVGMAISGASSLVILWVGGHLVMDGSLSVGELIFASTLLGYMTGPLERLAGVSHQVQDALVALERLGEILDLPEEESAERRESFSSLKRGIRFENVTFRYGSREEVLSGITLDIPAGQTTAIVGESGSGKSTLCKLLAGFYVPSEGRILMDGIDQRSFQLQSLRSRVGWVQQDPFVFSGTIRENIAASRPEAKLAEIVEVARLSELEDFIERLPNRYETKIGERGVNLSGGQRQRLAIARAILRRPELFIFDEATSHLDTRTERAIQSSLSVVLPGRTTVLIAHRLSTVLSAHQIVVLDRGRVVERGTHEELMRRGGKYKELWSGQEALEPFITVDEEISA